MAAGGVYSRRFIVGKLEGTSNESSLLYTVPTGQIAIVRSVTIWCFTAGTGLFGLMTGAGQIRMVSSAGIPAGETRHTEMHMVFNSGDLMGWTYASGAHNVAVSGFLLNTL